MNNPSVSILICTNKLGEQFYESIKSACCQDYNNLTIAIFLDGIYNPELHQQIARFLRSHDREFLITGSSESIGLTKGLIALQANSTAKFFARIDVGDIWYINKITRQVQAAIENKVSIIGTRSQYINQDGAKLGLSPLLPAQSDKIIHRIASYKGLYDHSSILFSSEYKYDADWYYSQDMKLYTDIANNNGTFGYISDPLTLVRFNPTGITIRNRPQQAYYEKEARRRLGVYGKTLETPKKLSELSPASSLFVCSYKKFVISMQKKEYTSAYLFLLVSCLSDFRLFGYYTDRVIQKACMLFR